MQSYKANCAGAYITAWTAALLLVLCFAAGTASAASAHPTADSVPISIPSIGTGDTIPLGTYTLRAGDRISYDIRARTGTGMQAGFSAVGTSSQDTIYYAVTNYRAGNGPLVCSSQFVCGPPAPAGTYEFIIRAADGPLGGVTGTLRVEHAASDSPAAPFLTEPAPNGGVCITGSSGTAPTDLEIPSQINGRTVTAIGDYAFAYESNLARVSVPATVRSIGASAFRECPALESITLPPDGPETIGEEAFAFCESLAEIRLPDTISQLGGSVFWHCTQLSRVLLPSELAEIPDGAFGYCSTLHEITLPNRVQRIGASAFSSAGLLEIDLPNSIRNIGEGAFSGCQELTRLELPDTMAEVSAMLAADCTALKSVDLPAHCESIGESAFSHCTSLRDVCIPPDVQKIDPFAFWECKKLDSVTLPEGVETVAYGTFWGCSALRMLGLPVSVAYVEGMAFYGAPLQAVYYAGTPAQWSAVSVEATGRTQTGVEVPDSNSALRNAVVHYHEEMPILPAGVSLRSDSPLTVQEWSNLGSLITGYAAYSPAKPITTAELRAQFVLPDGMWCVVRTPVGTARPETAGVCTGDTVELRNADGIRFTGTLVIAGDVRGTGTMTLSQLVRMTAAYMHEDPLLGPYLLAGDFQNTDSITLSDITSEAQLYVRSRLETTSDTRASQPKGDYSQKEPAHFQTEYPSPARADGFETRSHPSAASVSESSLVRSRMTPEVCQQNGLTRGPRI